MVKSIFFRIPLAAMIAAVCSCAAPKAVVVEENAPTMAVEEPKKEEPAAEPEPVIAGPSDDGIRLPDMLALPGENEFRNTRTPGGGRSPGSGAVIARPPSE